MNVTPKSTWNPFAYSLVAKPPTLVAAQLRVRNLRRAERFYDFLGLRSVARWTMKDGQRLVWMRDPASRQTVELYFVPRRSPLFEPFRRERRYYPQLLFTSRGTADLLPRLLRAGARLLAQVTDRGVQITFLRDPEGNTFEIVAWAAGRRVRRPGRPLDILLQPRKAVRRPGLRRGRSVRGATG